MPSKLDKKEEAMNSRSIYLPALCVSLLLSPLSLDSQAFDINNPGPSASGDWTIYPGSYNSQRYSPLKQVNLANVHLLQVKWVYHVAGAHGLEPTPVVKDGVMYIPLFNRVDAVDARTGNILWRYQQSPASTAAYRGTSIYDGKVFVATTDAHLVALDARNGALVWDVPVDGGRPLSGAAPSRQMAR